MSRTLSLFALVLLAAAVSLISREPQRDPRLRGAHREAAREGWTKVYLEGEPGEIGFQHGFLLSSEIIEARKIIALELEHDTSRPWQFFRENARAMFWPKIDAEYRKELEGIAAGLKARGSDLDVWDVTALNGWLEWTYYTGMLEKKDHGKRQSPVAERCSAFVATGSFTRDGRIVIGHNAWTGYMDGSRWTIVFDIKPAAGHRMIMDGFPGLIHSGDDFGINAAGMMITETTISNFEGFDPNGVPEFVRARKAMQYASSIDEFARYMSEGNNGGYANNWLVGDRKTGEIASLELGLKNVTLRRTRDGYFSGANFPVSEKLIREETNYDAADGGVSGNARRKRWDEVITASKGKIDTAAARGFLGDHYDAFAGKVDPNERTLCGHLELSPRGVKGWWEPYGTAGAVQNKVADSEMAAKMTFEAAAGHACGLHFKAGAHLEKYPQFAWQREHLRDMPARNWASFSAR